ncbi:putative histone-like DNA-binding protein [Bacteroides heparinolyticus]|uniref:Putative histone-like DNA-binding protein n=1 Tax=Prevotella heparinolytica TaxID=28113 RepID=A0A4R2LQX0_9BACE|nr:HU family DNA-binding protein [Bacteroides heparinolyticus]TCO92584.1 putative histone-like DNA-binding protein [Bacteroides heparinolyticus]
MLIHQVKKETAYIGKNKGKTVYYAAPMVQDKITTRQVEDRIINATALSRADVRSAITALAEIVREEMFAGRAVDLADLGSFKVVSIGKRVMTEKEVTADTLKVPRIQFFPKMEMRNQAKNIQRIVLRSGESVPEQPGGTPTPGGTPSPTPGGNPLG